MLALRNMSQVPFIIRNKIYKCVKNIPPILHTYVRWYIFDFVYSFKLLNTPNPFVFLGNGDKNHKKMCPQSRKALEMDEEEQNEEIKTASLLQGYRQIL